LEKVNTVENRVFDEVTFIVPLAIGMMRRNTLHFDSGRIRRQHRKNPYQVTLYRVKVSFPASRKMFSTFARRSAPFAAASKRMMSGHANVEEVRAEVSKWKKMTAGKLSFTIAPL
jgi:hypothetical protein